MIDYIKNVYDFVNGLMIKANCDFKLTVCVHDIDNDSSTNGGELHFMSSMKPKELQRFIQQYIETMRLSISNEDVSFSRGMLKHIDKILKDKKYTLLLQYFSSRNVGATMCYSNLNNSKEHFYDVLNKLEFKSIMESSSERN